MTIKNVVHVTAPSDFDDDPLTDILPDNTTSSGESKAMSDPVRGQKNMSTNSAVTKQPFVDEGMDLFPTKGSREPRSTSSSKSDFMSELFGEKKATSSAAKSQPADFQLDEIYTKAKAAADPDPKVPTSQPPPGRGGRRRTLNPVIGQSQPPSTDLISSMAALDTSPTHVNRPQLPPAKQTVPSNQIFPSAAASETTSSNPEHQQIMQTQLAEMQDFESRQREQFQRDLQEQQRLMEAKQREYQTAMDQQKSMTQSQVAMIQERQKSMLKQQQQQTEVLLRQIQTQMEADMRLKSEMTRNQLQVLTEMQMRNPSDQVPSLHAMLGQLKGPSKE